MKKKRTTAGPSLVPVDITSDDRALSIARRIMEIITSASRQIKDLRRDQEAQDAGKRNLPNGQTQDVIKLPAVTQEQIDARLGDANIQFIELIQGAVK